MLKLSDKRFADYLRGQAETGMGYWIVTVRLKDGRIFPQTVVNGGIITRIKSYEQIPFALGEIESLEVTHDRWNWQKDD